MNERILATALTAAVIAPEAALAYVGPGAGLTAIGSVVAFIGVIALLLAGFVWYPVKRLVRAARGRQTEAGAAPGAPGNE